MKAEYIDHLGSDLTVVNAARVSFDKESAFEVKGTGPDGQAKPLDEGKLSEKDQGLIKYLAKHDHWSPFAHPQVTFRYTVPIFVARQEFKHIVGFVRNEISRRYVDDLPEFFLPDEWRGRPVGAKQGSSDEVITHFPKLGNDYALGLYDYQKIDDCVARTYENCEALYRAMIKAGIAPEQARMVLPQAMYTSYYVTGSLAAFARFYKQRMDPHAQAEVRELALQIEPTMSKLFPESWRALTCEKSV